LEEKIMTAIYDHLLECLIELNKQNRKIWEKEKEVLSITDFILEFGIIRLDIGRAVGKSNFIKTHATEKDLVLTFGNRQANILQKETKATTCNVDNIVMPLICPRIFETIYVDEPYLTFKNKDMIDFLKLLIYNTEQTIILLGK
jgi:hypothetical protein